MGRIRLVKEEKEKKKKQPILLTDLSHIRKRLTSSIEHLKLDANFQKFVVAASMFTKKQLEYPLEPGATVRNQLKE
jgi:hypothetical protein